MKTHKRSQGGLLDIIIPHNPIGKMIDMTMDAFSPKKSNKSESKTIIDVTPSKDKEIISETKITRILPKTGDNYLGATKSHLGAQKKSGSSMSKVNRAEADEWTKKLNAQRGPWKGISLKKGGSATLADSQFMRDLRKK